MTVIVDHKIVPASTTTGAPLKKPSFFQEWLIMPKILYFMLSFVIYTFHNLNTTFFIKEWGLKLYEIGYLSAFGGLSFFGAIFWSNLADRTGKHKLILIISTIGYCLFISLLGLDMVSKENKWLRFTYVSAAYGMSSVFQAGIFPLLDAAVLGILMKDPRFSKDLFGYQRMAGSISHAVVNAVTGFLAHYIGFGSLFVFLLVTGSIFIACVIVGIPHDAVSGNTGGHHGHHGHGHGSNANKAGEVREIKSWRDYPSVRLLTNFNFLFFMLFVLTTGIVRTVLMNYQAQFTMDKFKVDPFISGLISASRVFSEIGIFLIGKQLIATFGVYWMLIFAQVTGILRLFGYTVVPSGMIAAAFGLELLKGLNSGLIVSSAIRIASDMAPKGCEGTAQALFSGNYNGLSNAVCGVVAGYLLYIQRELPDKIQLQNMFLWVSIGSTIVTFLLALKYALIDRVLGCSKKSRQGL